MDFEEDEVNETSEQVQVSDTALSELLVVGGDEEDKEGEEEILRQRNEEIERRRKKLELEESKQIAKDEEIQNKKRRKFEKEVKAIFENLDNKFTFKPLNSFERKIIHDMATKYKLYHETSDDKLIISKTPLNKIDELNEQLNNVHIAPGYNLRSKK